MVHGKAAVTDRSLDGIWLEVGAFRIHNFCSTSQPYSEAMR